jgi:hypothetical protein
MLAFPTDESFRFVLPIVSRLCYLTYSRSLGDKGYGKKGRVCICIWVSTCHCSMKMAVLASGHLDGRASPDARAAYPRRLTFFPAPHAHPTTSQRPCIRTTHLACAARPVRLDSRPFAPPCPRIRSHDTSIQLAAPHFPALVPCHHHSPHPLTLRTT